MLIGPFIRNIVTKEAMAKALPIAKKVLIGATKLAAEQAARIAAEQAGKTVGEKTAEVLSKGPKKVESYVDKKKKEFILEAESKAEQFFAKQIVILEEKIDKKINETEIKLDEKIKGLFWLLLPSMFIVMVLAGLTFSLLFKYFNF